MGSYYIVFKEKRSVHVCVLDGSLLDSGNHTDSDMEGADLRNARNKKSMA